MLVWAGLARHEQLRRSDSGTDYDTWGTTGGRNLPGGVAATRRRGERLMAQDTLTQYLGRIRGGRLLDAAEERSLSARAQEGDKEA